MTVRNAQHVKTTHAPAMTSSINLERTHRSVKSRRAHRESHALLRRLRHQWMCFGAAALAAPFALAIVIVELVH